MIENQTHTAESEARQIKFTAKLNHFPFARHTEHPGGPQNEPQSLVLTLL